MSFQEKILNTGWWIRRAYIWIYDDLPAEIRAFYQRGVRGFSDRDCWDLNDHLAVIIPKMLAKMKTGISHPADCKSQEEWHAVLDQMADGFNAHVEACNLWDEDRFRAEGCRKAYKAEMKELEKRRVKGMTLFVKWFNNLWD